MLRQESTLGEYANSLHRRNAQHHRACAMSSQTRVLMVVCLCVAPWQTADFAVYLNLSGTGSSPLATASVEDKRPGKLALIKRRKEARRMSKQQTVSLNRIRPLIRASWIHSAASWASTSAAKLPVGIDLRAKLYTGDSKHRGNVNIYCQAANWLNNAGDCTHEVLFHWSQNTPLLDRASNLPCWSEQWVSWDEGEEMSSCC